MNLIESGNIELAKGWTQVKLSENFEVYYDYRNGLYNFGVPMDEE